MRYEAIDSKLIAAPQDHVLIPDIQRAIRGFTISLLNRHPCLRSLRASEVIISVSSSANGLCLVAELCEISQLNLRFASSYKRSQGHFEDDIFLQDFWLLHESKKCLAGNILRAADTQTLAEQVIAGVLPEERDIQLRKESKTRRRYDQSQELNQLNLLFTSPAQLPVSEISVITAKVEEIRSSRVKLKKVKEDELSSQARTSRRVIPEEITLIRLKELPSYHSGGQSLAYAMDTDALVTMRVKLIFDDVEAQVSKLELVEILR